VVMMEFVDANLSADMSPGLVHLKS
jgi:hypothetical protein